MKKNKLTTLLLSVAALFATTTACDDNETYAELRDRERKQIESFLKHGTQVESEEKGEYLLEVPGNIKVISESQFYANDSTTDVSKNEYVLFKGSGVYMQIVRKGVGKKLEEGESARVINRFTEFNIAADSITATNRTLMLEPTPDIMTCNNYYGQITASFVSGVMSQIYKTNAVPSGWIVPLHFINIGRQDAENSEIALVRLILPSTEGQNEAKYNVQPCFYEISYQRGR